MITIRQAAERGHADRGWLDSYHTFSFADYFDPNHMGFKTLRVINEDRIAPGAGFPTHAHRDMEIITYMLAGELEHKDSMGNGSVIPTGAIQYMSAGSGVTHSEFNHSQENIAHLLQIWIIPNVRNVPPRYDQRQISREEKLGRLHLVASPDGEAGSIAIRQDARLYAGILTSEQKINFELPQNHSAWLHVVHGRLTINKTAVLRTSDAAAIEGERNLKLFAQGGESEFLLFDLL